ncbi:diguanylate cyclase domain-containing protein [Devosia sp. SL43]|uniref:diguanylate cyclase domain-containing protein n=1 Tax=Devosia sp. SL43 TaxID=2806348 RepID=UPI001F39C7C8|nr:diguanylate cyclase [Devosia sp. SL43]UJW85507.1 diguanylate cyclase [Devosia sp. SL43]
MTDTLIAKETADSFWARVRAALVGSRPAPNDRPPAYGQAAIARSLGMKPRLGARIEEELVAGWNHAAARRVSMSLLVVEIDRMADYFAAYGKADTDDCVLAVMRAVTDKLPRPGDTCLRLGRATFVIVLSDLPMLMARACATKIADAVRELNLPHKESHAGIVTVSTGLAVGNPQGGYDKKFFETAAEALKKAQRKGLGRIEAVDLRPAQERKRKAA